ncbi:4-carboxymuconolactone decarboxylase domain/alkylhydroperoxidase AhpD family core domain protein [Marinobacterium lacunae]|uniref:4-carboxymuconolactone decarboxylase domain/alkylhydroperoxidase AhpD family core domain protein n=1 Tax=Marinobacterium lacunae TaxID=1232683 RepID=A0A081G4R2_9GAMM|nr:carboxymuconolactone decarboxylase family protein [Marinobacterium lacunae]KEA65767.1 4-carboxymuconolactone decarboxylase domain/alkylhydroperoxidase AhpD family core domain protein [Marinobacterium lacunae]MBR9884336.1 carboxymuconolactone decarboxylase family protein [Oceanospirillales bacterium]
MQRLDPNTAAPSAISAMLKLEDYVRHSGLEYSLIELVKTRASQINGCAFCLHMHTRDAREAGETEERLYLLSAWRESSLYSKREQAALAWTESLTLIADTQAPDADYTLAKQVFTDKELVDLTLLIGAINVWNRIAVGFRYAHPLLDAENQETATA